MKNSVGKDTQLNRARKESPDGGFTLVELLIAVTILAVIVVPLLHMFVTSTRINVKSRQTLRATTVAQDIMEGLKAYTLEEVRAQFEPPEGNSGSDYYVPQDGFYIVNSSMIQGGVRELTELETAGEEIYYFGMEDLKLQGGEYDALIVLDASTYGDKVSTDPDAAHDNQFNGTYYAEIGSISEVGGDETDSSYHQDKDLDETVVAEIRDQLEDAFTAAGKEVPDELEDLEPSEVITGRNIMVELSRKEITGGDDVCQAKITIDYQWEFPGSWQYQSQYDTVTDSGTITAVDGITRSFSSGNFYLFYYPFYSLTKQIDEITFDIKDAAILLDEEQPLLKSLTLVKQIRSDVDTASNTIAPELSDADLLKYENSYRAAVGFSADAVVSGSLSFRTNIDVNLAEPTEELVGITYYSIPGNLSANIDQYSIPNLGIDSTGGSNIQVLTENTSGKVTNVIYDITISVYQAGAAEHFTETNFEDLEEVNRLAVITN